MFASSVTIRVAGPDDSRTLESLASSPRRSEPLAGKALLAEHDCVPVAAIALTSGSILTDLLNPTGDAERLLKLTRYGILRQGGQTGAARALLRRAQTRRHQTPSRPQAASFETGIACQSDGHDRVRPRTARANLRHPVTGRAGSELLAFEARSPKSRTPANRAGR
jgi:hypothetical protein